MQGAIDAQDDRGSFVFGRNVHSILAAGVMALALAAAPGSALADGACDDTSSPDTWQAFSAFGDDADYFLAPGGDFESGSRGWQLRNAAIVDGNEDAGVLAGNHSLQLGDGTLLGGLLGSLVSGGSRAISPPLCVTSEHPSFRYLFKANGVLGQLDTAVRYKDADGDTHEVEVRTGSTTNLLAGEWQPSEIQPLASALPIDDFGGQLEVRLVFKAPLDIAGGYQIDNVLIDPYRGY